MQTKTIIVPNISCGHCTNTIKEEISEITGVTEVAADVQSKQVIIKWADPATWHEIDEMLHEINFPPQQLIQIL